MCGGIDSRSDNDGHISLNNEHCFDGGSSWSLQEAFVSPGATSTLPVASAFQLVINHTVIPVI